MDDKRKSLVQVYRFKVKSGVNQKTTGFILVAEENLMPMFNGQRIFIKGVSSGSTSEAYQRVQ